MRKLFIAIVVFASLALVSHAQSAPNPKDYTAHMVGYAHIDLAWLWQWDESVHDVMYHTLSNQLKLMDADPDFTFAQDQAVVLDSMERDYPDIFKGLVAHAKSGGFIPVTSSWVQMDENLSDGESLVRQFLYGQKYSKEKFGHYIRYAWQPDVFGHPVTMPQIARKAGIEFYLFQRPSDPSRPTIIRWQGLDGSQVLGYTAPGWYDGPVTHDRTTVDGMKAAEQMGVKDVLELYGTGDHGGGPNPQDVANIATLNASPTDVRVKMSNISDYVDMMLAKKDDFPVYEKEMNPVFAGCYTSQVDMKRHNREAEQLLLNAEKMTELAVFFHYRDYSPSRDLNDAWKLVLLNQTHDLAAGSGIGPIYADAARQYQEVFERGAQALNFSLEDLGLQVDTLGAGVPLVVYNTQSWDRTGLVTAQVSASSLPERMVAVHGQETTPVQILKAPIRSGTGETTTVAFVASDVPQMGLKLYRIVAADTIQKAENPQAAASKPALLRSGSTPRPFLENQFLRVEIDPRTGNIASLYDKVSKRETFHGEGNSLTAWEDTAEDARRSSKEYAGPAWNIGLSGKKWDLDQVESVKLIEQGPVRATIRVVKRFRDSLFTQDISLTAGIPRVDVSMTVDWYEREILLKANFPVAFPSTKVTADIPYGAIERDQNGEEDVMGKWVDISNGDGGVAILNNGRNGYDAKDSVIHLSVIRGPWSPDPRADEGEHTFGYSIYPHNGGWRDGKVEFQAMAFNSPLLAMQELKHASPQSQWGGNSGGLPDSYSFIKTDSDHVVLYALKQMEGFYDTDAIARFVETEGREGDVTVEFPAPVRATETTLLEDVKVGPVGEGKTLHFHMKPWEIKTLRLSQVQ